LQRDGVGKLSILGELLENNDSTQGGSKEREDMIKNVAAAAYVGTYLNRPPQCLDADCENMKPLLALYALMLIAKDGA
jgi:hypothetical protein